MFKQVWKKYLPVITILIKRSVQGDQVLNMNHTDFERAAGGRKIKHSFSSLQIVNGRVQNMIKLSPIPKEFTLVLQEEELTRKLIQKMHLEFSMNNNFQLSIKNQTPPAEAPVLPEESSEAGNADSTDVMAAANIS